MATKATHIHAFEPLPENIKGLHALIKKPPYDETKITIHGVALTDHNGTEKLYLNGRNSSTIATSWNQFDNKYGYTEDNFIDVPTRTLDSFNLTGVTGCKIDVERNEQWVLEGGANTFTYNHMVLSFETHQNVNCAKILDLLHSYGYTVWNDTAIVSELKVDAGYFASNIPEITPAK